MLEGQRGLIECYRFECEELRARQEELSKRLLAVEEKAHSHFYASAREDGPDHLDQI
jgi:hypothetical protein